VHAKTYFTKIDVVLSEILADQKCIKWWWCIISRWMTVVGCSYNSGQARPPHHYQWHYLLISTLWTTSFIKCARSTPLKLANWIPGEFMPQVGNNLRSSCLWWLALFVSQQFNKQLANNKISKVDMYMNPNCLEIILEVRILMKLLGFFCIFLLCCQRFSLPDPQNCLQVA